MKLKNILLLFSMTAIFAFPVTAIAGDAPVPAPAQDTAPVEQVADTAASSEDNAKIFETQDGVLSIEAPRDNDKWAVIQDDQKWFAMSDGTDTITVDHYANGDDIPAVALARDPFVQVDQVYFSTENEVFVVTGEVTVAEDMPYVRDAVNSFQVLKYDTKQAVQPQPEEDYSIRKINSDMYCITSDGVNVRASYSTSSDVIGGVSYKDKVFVIGEVTKDGENIGWLKIQYGNGEGYVYDQWFDDNEPADPERTGDEMTLFREDGGSTILLYEYTDGQWRDDTGMIYYPIGEHTWQSENIGQYFWYDDPGYIGSLDNEESDSE